MRDELWSNQEAIRAFDLKSGYFVPTITNKEDECPTT